MDEGQIQRTEAEASATAAAPARQRLEEVGDLVISITKAILRVGYYTPDHPSGRLALHGLHQQFKQVVGEAPELTLVLNDSEHQPHVLIGGLFDGMYDLENVLTSTAWSLYIPKIAEFFVRRELVSFSLKRQISEVDFARYLQLLSEPFLISDRARAERTPADLFLERVVVTGIHDVSFVFQEDIGERLRKLPWLVQMSLSRLYKDLKTLPLYKNITPDRYRRIKRMVISDILRPIRDTAILIGIFSNCHLIAEHIQDMTLDELEQAVVECVVIERLSKVVLSAAEQLGRLQQPSVAGRSAESLARERATVERMLRYAVPQLCKVREENTVRALFALVERGTIHLAELPAEVQEEIRAMNARDRFLARVDEHLRWLDDTDNAPTYEAVAAVASQVAPLLAERGDVPNMCQLLSLLARQALDTDPPFPQRPQLAYDTLRPLVQPGFLQPLYQALAGPQLSGAELGQQIVDAIRLLGQLWLEPLLGLLQHGPDGAARTAASQALLEAGTACGALVYEELTKPHLPWAYLCDLIAVAAAIGPCDLDDALRPLCHHVHPRVRQTALSTLLTFRGSAVESLLVNALVDPEPWVRRWAISQVGAWQTTDAKALHALVAALEDRKDDLAQAAAASALAAVGNVSLGRRDVVATLIDALEPRPSRSLLSRAMGHLHRPRRAEVREAIAAALSALGTNQALEAVAAYRAELAQGGAQQFAAVTQMLPALGEHFGVKPGSDGSAGDQPSPPPPGPGKGQR